MGDLSSKFDIECHVDLLAYIAKSRVLGNALGRH